MPHVNWQERLPSPEAPFDLVSASNALVTMPAEAVEATMLALWERTAPGGLLALVEPATLTLTLTRTRTRTRTLTLTRTRTPTRT